MTDQQRCGRFRTFMRSPHAITVGLFVFLFAGTFFINTFVSFRFSFFLYLFLFFGFVVVFSCFQNIYKRVDNFTRKCFRRGVSNDPEPAEGNGSVNSSTARVTPVAWQEGNTNYDRTNYGSYTNDRVLQLPSLGQTEDMPPSYDDVISSDALPPSYEEATKVS